MGFEAVTYRPTTSRVLAALTMVMCAVGVVSIAWYQPLDALRYGWGLVLLAVLAYALYWRPALIVEEHGITVVNVFRTEFVAWPAIVAIDTKWALTLRTADRTVRVWATPAPGRHRTLGLSRGDFAGIGTTARGAHESLRPSDAISTASGNLAQLIRGHWERMTETGVFAHGVDPEATRTTWHAVTIAVVAAVAAATVIGIVL